jgi:predicted aldo/keto reductase-like oxidoreductase
MDQPSRPHPDRRTFLRAGAAAATAVGIAPTARAQDEPSRPPELPRRKLGKTGMEVTILEQGAVHSPALDRLFRSSFSQGIRVFDTAKAYRTEPAFRRWFEAMPEVRKEIFLVTKDMPKTADQIPAMVEDRLRTLGIDQIDLFFIHGLGDEHPLDEAMRLVKSRELARVSDELKKAGKIRFLGFSTHHKDRAAIIRAAAEGGIVDAIMLQYTPWLEKDSPLNRAIDAAWKAGIGLISMKQIAGRGPFGDRPKFDVLKEAVRRVPAVRDKKLSPYQGLLHAIWSDERISTVCISMRNLDQIRENAQAARSFAPLQEADLRALRDAVIASGPTLCADCDGRCSLAAGTRAELGNLTRFLTYYQHLGDRAKARREYAALPEEARDWKGADLAAACAACPHRLDFARLLPEVDRYLA